jgi:hypothetical protein
MLFGLMWAAKEWQMQELFSVHAPLDIFQRVLNVPNDDANLHRRVAPRLWK